jgi:hypothetical protein
MTSRDLLPDDAHASMDGVTTRATDAMLGRPSVEHGRKRGAGGALDGFGVITRFEWFLLLACLLRRRDLSHCHQAIAHARGIILGGAIQIVNLCSTMC